MSNSISGSIAGIGDMIDFFDDMAGGDDEVAWYVGTVVEYAKDQEFGTSKMQAANGGMGFIRPAIERVSQNEYMNSIKSELEELIDGGINTQDLIIKAALEVEKQAADLSPVRTGNLQASIQAGPSLDEMSEKSASEADFIRTS